MLITPYLGLKAEFNWRLGVYLYHSSPLWLRNSKTTIKGILDCCSTFLKEKNPLQIKIYRKQKFMFWTRVFHRKIFAEQRRLVTPRVIQEVMIVKIVLIQKNRGNSNSEGKRKTSYQGRLQNSICHAKNLYFLVFWH